MCFTVQENKELTADKDIVCYKWLTELMLGNSYESPYYGMIYNIGQRYNLENRLESKFHYDVNFTTHYIIDEGYHSFITAMACERHINSSSDFMCGHPRDRIVKCIIPKGAHYYVNHKTNEYVSDAIIVKRKTIKFLWMFF